MVQNKNVFKTIFLRAWWCYNALKLWKSLLEDVDAVTSWQVAWYVWLK